MSDTCCSLPDATGLAGLAGDWPGKSEPSEHPALWHMLDVGAVAQELLRRSPIAGKECDSALLSLAAMHDLGKISGSFRDMLRQGRKQQFRHWQHTAMMLGHYDALLERYLRGEREVRRLLVEAVAGHHGGPRHIPSNHEAAQQKDEIGEEAMEAAKQAIAVVMSLFPDASLHGVSEPQAAKLAWQVNGLVVQADWIGSNPEWFPPASPDIGLQAYWERARQQAARAIIEAGLVAPGPAGASGQGILPEGVKPHPMQDAAMTRPLPEGPVLGVIEDATGAGKTEAALILAARMMDAGKGAGLFFALPTMATANAMLPRLERVAGVLFDKMPTLALSHGRARLSERFRAIQGRVGANPEDGPHCSRWLADDRRRALLADLGVGTVDQALFAVLPTRFNGLRLRALSRKILIVDEAHSYDPYMQAQLERLLRMQARMGGSAIVMTATLPSPKKFALVTAFENGLRPPRRRQRPETEPKTGLSAYPALTLVGETRDELPVGPARGTVRRVAVERLGDMDAAVDLIVEAAGKEAAVAWIRNAVDDAIAAVEALRGRGVKAELLHARFALCDRLAREDSLQARFGVKGEGRAGRVLVATQVAEQSLDLDFDVMVSDLAPIGAMIQRAGRLWRHMEVRPQGARPVPGPVLHVLSPDPERVDSVRWLHEVLDRGAFVYDPTVTWRSARAVFDEGGITAPEGLRELIEAVEGDEPLPLPDALKEAEFKREGQEIVERQMAVGNLVNVTEGFDQGKMQKVWDEEKFPTRLGVPQRTLALARRGANGLEPLAEAEEVDRWALSEVQVAATRFDPTVLDQSGDEIQAVKKDWTRARADNTWIAVLGEDGRICDGLRYDRELGAVWE